MVDGRNEEKHYDENIKKRLAHIQNRHSDPVNDHHILPVEIAEGPHFPDSIIRFRPADRKPPREPILRDPLESPGNHLQNSRTQSAHHRV